ncbi:MAG: hypothetical protein JW768_09610 [Chitinispirillaceae bacterium]|nr:hypothetical protein [Chitinispirillaceae bacterium]
MKPFRIALCQIRSRHDCDETIGRAFDMLAVAAKSGANLAVLPEIFYLPYELPAIKKRGDMSRLVAMFADTARRYNLHICSGTMAIKGRSGLSNTSHLITPDGETALSYSKTHLFEMTLGKTVIRESRLFTAGNRFPVARTALGTIGTLICYDIRFPEAARKLALEGAELLLVPANFNAVTGPAHWHVMHRARAIENQVFLAAVSQARNPASSYAAYGHSLVVSPWGEILAEAGEEETIIFADLEPGLLEQTRTRLPLMRHRRKDLYGDGEPAPA